MESKAEAAFASLVRRVGGWRRRGERVVMCHGCFDPLHVGHLLHFRAAKEFGDRLVVTVTPDRFVNKGPDRPLFPQDLRLEMVLALRVVDAAAINLWDTAVETISRLRPHYFVKGSDYRDNALCNPNFFLEKEQVERVGGELIYTDEQAFSSTELIKWMNGRTA